MLTNLRIVTPPTAEPLTLAQAKTHLKIDYEDTSSPPVPFPDDALLEALIVTARTHAENYLARALVDTGYEWRFNCLRSPMFLPIAPVRSIDEITYLDTDGAQQTLDAAVYYFDDNYVQPSLWLAYGQSWPSTRWQSDGVRVTFTAGPDIAGSPPQRVEAPITQGMLLLIAHLNRNRDAVEQLVDGMPAAVRNLWQPYRREMGV